MIDASLEVMDPLPALPVQSVASLAQAMDTTGFGVWENAVSETLLLEMRDFIARELVTHGNEYFVLAGRDWIRTSPLAGIASSTSFRAMLESLWRHGTSGLSMDKRPLPEAQLVTSLRVLTGELGARHSQLYHYDSYVVTALIPIVIPSLAGKLHGDLMMYPNLRQIRRSALINICEKLVVESGVARKFWGMAPVYSHYGAKRVQMSPGNIYFFWGMRSLHANQTCDVDSLRSTALFHFGDPHAGGFMKKLSGAHHRYKQRQIRRSLNNG